MSAEGVLFTGLLTLALLFGLAVTVMWKQEQPMEAASTTYSQTADMENPPVEKSTFTLSPVTVEWACEQRLFWAKGVSCEEDAWHLYIPMSDLEHALHMAGRSSYRKNFGWELTHWQKGHSNYTVTVAAYFRIGLEPYVEFWDLASGIGDAIPYTDIQVSGLPVTTYSVAGGKVVVQHKTTRSALWSMCDVAFEALEEYNPSEHQEPTVQYDEDGEYEEYFIDRECTLKETPLNASPYPVQTDLATGEAVLLVYGEIQRRRAYPAYVGEGGIVQLPLPDTVHFVDEIGKVGSPSNYGAGDAVALVQVTNVPLNQLEQHIIVPARF